MLLTPMLDPAVEARLLDLNRNCPCLPVDPATPGLHLPDPGRFFAKAAVMLTEAARDAMLDQVAALEAATATQTFRDLALGRAGLSPRPAQDRTRGLLMGYDFHIAPAGPRLIEINTNAGGAFLTAGLIPEDRPRAEAALLAMILSEWRAAGRSGHPHRIAIVDEDPQGQFLFPDMCAARDLLTKAGIETLIVAPPDLVFDSKALRVGDLRIDMVYNRLTDFALSAPGLHALRAAYAADRIVLSPAPQHHALLADKRNLVLLSDPDFVATLGLAPAQRATLARLPRSRAVTLAEADGLWQDRRALFFKPATGFGSRGAYRGDKLTRRVWDDILAADYIAQDLVPPPTRRITGPEGETELKWDLRLFTYAGDLLFMAARLYQGQTTNFRTPGGGFAPVVLHHGFCAKAA